MVPAKVDEAVRLRTLDQYRVCGTPVEGQFDHIAQLASSLFAVPIAVVSFVEAERVWLKSRVGLDVCEVPRADAFCSVAVQSEATLVVPDLAADPRFAENPSVQAEGGLRFYAGAPLKVQTGHRIGVLAILDHEPRFGWSRKDDDVLRSLAALVVDHLESRRHQFTDAAARGLAETAQDALLCIDADGTITFVNRAALALFGYERQEMIGRTLDIIMPERFRSAHAGGVARIAAGGPSRLDGKSVELSALRRNGEEFPIEISISSWRGPYGMSMGAVLRDISERKKRDQQMHRLANQDPLTGLANRLRFEAALAAAFEANQPVAILLFDLDRFKMLNDTYGHGFGDGLLQTMAVRLQAVLDDTGLVARFGGDEFAVVLPGVGDPVRVASCAEAILTAFDAPIRVADHSARVGVSIGGAIGPNHGRDGEELIASADLALYRAKARGGSCYRLYEPGMRNALAAKRALEDELIVAFQQGEFVLHYQPQVRIDTQTLVGAEALLRWQHPQRGLLAPATFIEVLDGHTLAADVGDWTLDEVCRQFAAWRHAGGPTFRMGVNLFALQLARDSLPAIVEATLGRHGLKPDDLELEITETIALRYDARGLKPLMALRELGVGLAFDDFGTGFASLSTLKRVPLTTLKIDRGFVHGIMHDNHDVAVAAAVIDVGRRLGLDVVAEGIETAEQEARLRQLGCPVGQGFYYGRGVPAAVFSERWQRPGRAEPRRIGVR